MHQQTIAGVLLHLQPFLLARARRVQKPLCQNIVAQQVFAVDEKRRHKRAHSLFIDNQRTYDAFSPQIRLFRQLLPSLTPLFFFLGNLGTNCILKESSIEETFTGNDVDSFISSLMDAGTGRWTGFACYQKKMQ